MSDFEKPIGFQDCWTPKKPKSVRSKSAGYYSVGKAKSRGRSDVGSANIAADTNRASSAISASDKATLARVVRGAPEVMVKVTRPAKVDKSGKAITVSRASEGKRVGSHLEYISRNGKIELETSDGQVLGGKSEVAELNRVWM